MSDHLESMLERLDPAPAAGEPPAVFLRAVARRRWERRIAKGAVAGGLVLAAAGAWLLVSQPSPVPSKPILAKAAPGTVLALWRTNENRSPADLELYQPP